MWLDPAVTFPSTTAPGAWSRSEWLEATTPVWRQVVQPIAEHMQQVVGQSMPGQDLDLATLSENLPEQLRDMFPGGLPPEMAQMMAPMLGMLQQLGAAAFSMQLGQALAALAADVVGASDIGIPLTADAQPALLPRNVDAFGEGLGVRVDDVRLYLALRESAHQRLFAHVPWLRPRMIGAVEEYARGVRVDQSRLEEAMGDIDMSNPEALQQLMGSGLLQPEDTPEQQAALARLETLLALVEGWVDDVVDQAIAGSAAVGGPAARDDAPPPRRRRPGRADVRDAGRPGAATAPGPRGGDPVGRRARRPRSRGPRRSVGAPRPAARARRPGRPARLHRGQRQRARVRGADDLGRPATALGDGTGDDRRPARERSRFRPAPCGRHRCAGRLGPRRAAAARAARRVPRVPA